MEGTCEKKGLRRKEMKGRNVNGRQGEERRVGGRRK
jgi:hypothetical protein